jgi:hypothetical protein
LDYYLDYNVDYFVVNYTKYDNYLEHVTEHD